MRPTLKPFSEEDYPALAELLTAVYPDDPVTADDLIFDDETQGQKCRSGRFLALLGDTVVGEGTFGQDADMYHPRKFWIRINAHPQHEHQGVEALLYERVMAALEPHRPLSVLTNLREDYLDDRAFFSERGFVEVMRHAELRLVLAGFSLEAHAAGLARVEAEGILLKSYPELEEDAERDRKLHKLRNELDQQVPFAEPVTPVSYSWFEERILNHPKLLLGGLIVAVHEGEYVGMTALMKASRDRQLKTDLTGVRHTHRRKGVALGLKLKAIDYAKLHNYTAIRTWVSEENEGMLALNEKLGFQQRPALLEYVKTFGP